MPVLRHPRNSFFSPSICPQGSFFYTGSTHPIPSSNSVLHPLARTPKSHSGSPKNQSLSWNSPTWRPTHVPFCSKNEVFEGFRSTQLPETEDFEELELLGKPSPKPIEDDAGIDAETEPQNLTNDEVLEPFYRFFRPVDESSDEGNQEGNSELEGSGKISIEYYDPKPGDFVVGVVVSGNENKLDVNVGADLLGTMLTKEVLPLYGKEIEYLTCDLGKDVEEFMVRGRMGVLKNDEALAGGAASGKPVLEPGSVLFAEVLGRTLSGRPLLSMRRLFRRIAWHRVRQIKQLNEPIEVRITEWNTGGLLTRVEGLRAFIPKIELMNRINNFTELKENVGRRIYVLITRINEDTNDLILSEKEAWGMVYLREGTLLEGTVRKILPYGAQIRIGETNRSGLLHISNITKGRITSVSDLLEVDEKVKVLVMKSMFPDKISLSIAEIESKPGLFISDKERVFSEAEDMARKYRQRLPTVSATRKSESLTTNQLPFENEESMYSNWKWFKFERDNGPSQ